jgi:hypothetical protein
MSESDDFREMLARQAETEEAIVSGDAEPRLKLWSRQDPVSLLGAWWPNEWKIVHRHGDLAPADESPPPQAG